jgi:archaemetzincin
MKTSAALIIFISLLFAGCGGSVKNEAANSTNISGATKGKKDYAGLIKALEPFFKPMGKPGKYDWLATFQESGQTFAEYLAADPNLPDTVRKTLYIQPIGNFSPREKKSVDAAADYLRAFYQLPVKMLSTKQFPKTIAKDNFRMRGYPSSRQIRTGFILDEMLKPNLPKDAAALVAFTNEDLYTSDTMNFVFGQASLENRVAVWSLNRLGKNASPMIFLTRTIKIAVHETGHMFSMRHCTKYSCVMSGTNNLNETDSRPVDACPECTAKVIYLSGADAKKRFYDLAKFAAKNGMSKEEKEFDQKLAAIENVSLP